MTILTNDEIDGGAWNSLVDNSPYHRYEWIEIINRSYGLDPMFILMQDGSNYAAVGSFKTCKGYISLPYLSYSGFSYNSLSCLKELKDYLSDSDISIDSRDLCDFDEELGYVNSRAKINDLEDYWRGLSKNTRNQIRKSQKFGFEFKLDSNTDNFYYIYAKNMHRLGTPVHKKKYINLIKSTFDDCLVLTVYDKDKAIGSMLCLYDNDTLYDVMASTLYEYNKSYANYFLYWEAIKHLKDLNLTYLDMGRSTYLSGTYRFKQKFRPVNYSIRSSHTYTGNDGYQLASRIWRYMPYKASIILGPQLRKYLP